MKNFLQEGEKFTYTASGTVTPGDFVIVNGLHGVAENGGGSGDTITALRCGVFELPKATGTAWSQGDRLFWDSGTSKFTKDATKTPIGAVAFADALSADAVGLVAIGNGGGIRVVTGQATTTTASDTIVTGLSKVYGAVANLEDAPVIGCDRAQAVIGDQTGTPASGSILLKTYKPTASGDATPIAATTFSKKVNWIAVGI